MSKRLTAVLLVAIAGAVSVLTGNPAPFYVVAILTIIGTF